MGLEIVWEPRGVYKNFFGHVTDEELMQSVMTVEGDHRFDDLRYVINDFLKVDSLAVSENTVRTIAAIDGAAAFTNAKIKVAIVAIDPRIRALADLYAASPLNTYPTRVFSNPEDARSWI